MKKIIGNTVGTTMPRANYNQTDPSKADYIVGRENIASNADEPLIVTGNFPSGWVSQPTGATNPLTNGTNLSHTVDEMCEAFQAGRDVRIRLSNSDYNYEFGNWKMRYAELSVCRAAVLVAGTPNYYEFYAYGTAYAYGANGSVASTPMQITCNLNTTPMISTPVKKETATYAGQVEVN